MVPACWGQGSNVKLLVFRLPCCDLGGEGSLTLRRMQHRSTETVKC
jgi:hypothetical protein